MRLGPPAKSAYVCRMWSAPESEPTSAQVDSLASLTQSGWRRRSPLVQLLERPAEVQHLVPHIPDPLMRIRLVGPLGRRSGRIVVAMNHNEPLGELSFAVQTEREASEHQSALVCAEAFRLGMEPRQKVVRPLPVEEVEEIEEPVDAFEDR